MVQLKIGLKRNELDCNITCFIMVVYMKFNCYYGFTDDFVAAAINV